MTLPKRSLLPPASLADIAIEALAGQGQYGAITQLADDYAISRQQVYRLRDVGQQALLDAFSPQKPGAWGADVPDAQLEWAIVGLYTIAPNSTDDIVDLLPILFGGKRPFCSVVIGPAAIENPHSVLRPYIVTHKRVSQGFLDLFRFYRNARIRRWGRHKGTSALELMTSNKHDHWLDMLGFPPPI